MTAQLHARDISLALGARHILEGIDLSIDPGQRTGPGWGRARAGQRRIARAWADSRIQTIYGGTTEIMREIVGRVITGG